MYLEPPLDPREEPGTEREAVLEEQLGQFVRAASGAFSSNTERALKSDLAIYAEWCAERGMTALPAGPQTVAAFVDAMAEEKAPATVRRYVTSLVIAHRALGLEKTLKSPPVQLALKRMHRRKGRRQDQATGLTWPLRQRLLEAAGEQTDRRPQPRTARRRLRRHATQDGTGLPASPRSCLRNCRATAACWCAAPRPTARDRGEIVWVGRDTVRLVLRVARPGRDRGWAAVPLGRQGRADRRAAPSLPGAAHLQGDGARGRPAGSGCRGPLGALSPGGRGPGHGRRRHRAAGNPPRRAVEIHRDGQPLRRAACWRGAAARRSWPGCSSGPERRRGVCEYGRRAMMPGCPARAVTACTRPNPWPARASRAPNQKMLSSVIIGAGGGSGVLRGMPRTGLADPGKLCC